MNYLPHTTPRGFTLFIAMVLTSVILAVGIALLDVAYKQVLLASSARDSVTSFYNADSGMECALYADSADTFDYYAAPNSGTITCQKQSIQWQQSGTTGTSRTFTLSVPCTGGGKNADVTVVKSNTGTTAIYSNGYNTCDLSSPSLSERGIEVTY